ncbi:MAG: hypothetical protein AABX65_00085 [Nanoarchaeota archaeon]
MEEKNIIKSITALASGVIVIGLASLIHSSKDTDLDCFPTRSIPVSAQVQPAEESRKTSLSSLYLQAVAISAGEDSYWSMEEKVRFFNELDIKKRSGERPILQEGDIVYGFENLITAGDYLDVCSSTRGNQNPVTLGYVSRSSLESFIKANQTPESPLLEK